MAHRGRENADDGFMLAYACGATVEAAAQKAGISSRTAHRRLRDPEFIRKLNELRAEIVRRATDMLTAASVESAPTLLSLQDKSNPPAVRLGAARAAIEFGVKLRETNELAQRIAALEQEQQASAMGVASYI